MPTHKELALQVERALAPVVHRFTNRHINTWTFCGRSWEEVNEAREEATILYDLVTCQSCRDAEP